MEGELKKEIKGKEIANQLGVSEGHVSNVKSAYKKEGIQGIKPKAMGRKIGEKRIITPKQEKEIQYSAIIFKEGDSVFSVL